MEGPICVALSADRSALLATSLYVVRDSQPLLKRIIDGQQRDIQSSGAEDPDIRSQQSVAATENNGELLIVSFVSI